MHVSAYLKMLAFICIFIDACFVSPIRYILLSDNADGAYSEDFM